LVGLEENREIIEIVKAKSGRVLSIAYIKEPTAD
jgi:hypothetical protein